MSEKKGFNKKKIIIGTANFGYKYGLLNSRKQINIREIKKILNFCKKNKIDFFDTATSYGNSEKVIGNLSNLGSKIITKIPKINYQNEKKIDFFLSRLISNSLKLLKKKQIYAILFHDETQLLSKNGKKIFKSLNNFKQKKIIQKIGVSFYSTKKLLKTLNNYDLDLVQIPINYLDQKFLNIKIINLLKKKRVEVHARSIFLKGLLLKNYTKNRKFKKFIHYLNNWHKFNKVTNLESSISFLSNLDFISKYIVGIENLSQLKQIIKTKRKIIKKYPEFNSNFIKDPRKWSLKK
tara:strand:- start:29 stop:907 length:879 start_codon:yes stop_codon:yes gene_type:complete